MLLNLLYLVLSTCTDLRETCTKAGVIAITFTDGPVNNITSNILEEAEELDVKLTFYFTVHQKAKGNVGQVYRRAVDEGHSVGLQLNPNREYDSMTQDEMEDDVERQIDTIDKLTDTKIRYAKGPVTDGQANSELYDVLNQKGILMTYYSFCPYDHDDPMGEFRDTIETSNPKYDSFIVLMHDKQEGDTPYLREIVEIGSKNGYRFVNMDECLGDYSGEDSGGSGGGFKPRTGGVESIGALFLPLLIMLVQFL